MAGRKKTDEATRFWEKVEKRGDDECWPWLAGTSFGYGTFREEGAKLGWKTHAPRVVWRMTNGPIPEGLQIDHLCCNRLCCNPSHLELVTQSENIKRMWQRGRGNPGRPRGIQHGHAKLTENDVRQIRALKGEKSPIQIAGLFGISTSSVHRIQSRVYGGWAWLE